MDNLEKMFDRIFEKKAEQTEMPDTYNCACKAGKSYNKDDIECKKCITSSRLLDIILLQKIFELEKIFEEDKN